ncbi:lipoprotein insertase outer membrane protein LolB [Variovorax sp. RT4R15]|uniref:lipoprotein insertase outer membrane protein LolB n=1 Tax=Variovorax sp. RT4R15 TaxID=3443737 RepID=UPI003F449207
MNRRTALVASPAALFFIAGCASPPSAGVRLGSQSSESWSGRLALRIDSEPVQTFSAVFDLRGTPQAGELTLTTPIGNTLAVLQWSPGQALLKNGSQTKRYESVDALIEAATGAAIPVGALFGWLAGRDEPVPGWRADLSQFAGGRLQATRQSPQPGADLRIVFERS